MWVCGCVLGVGAGCGSPGVRESGSPGVRVCWGVGVCTCGCAGCAAPVGVICLASSAPSPCLQLEIGRDQIGKLTLLLSKANDKANEGLVAGFAGYLGWGK